MGYKTEQKEALISYLASHKDRQFTVAELSRELSATARIGTSTVYRLLHGLLEEGRVRRFAVEGGSRFYYRYVDEGCRTQLHLKCTACGRLSHLDATVAEFLQKQIMASNRFALDEHQTLLFGICRTCQKEKL